MKTMLTVQEIPNYLQKEDFVLKTQRQIAKDFHSIGYVFPPEFEENPLGLTQLIPLIKGALEEVMVSSDLSQLLYQIDIPESTSYSLVNQPDYLVQLSHLIIRREAYKIYLRSIF